MEKIPAKYLARWGCSYAKPKRKEFAHLYTSDITILLGWDGESVINLEFMRYETLKGSGDTIEKSFLIAYDKLKEYI